MMNIINCKCSEKWAGFAPLVLRMVVGIVFLAAGWQKVGMGHEAVAGFFTGAGIPAASFFAFVVTWVETLGGAALILGVLTHWASKLLIIDMLGAIFFVHLSQGFFLPNGYEFALTLAAALFSIMITGPGKWAVTSMKQTTPTQPMV